jgi:catechol-2,3-dioxygenase
LTTFRTDSQDSRPPADDEAPAGGAGLISGLAELTLETNDLAGLAAFYTGVLGLEVIDRQADRIWLALGESTRLGLWSPGEKEFGDRGGRHVHFAVSVTPRSLDGLLARLARAGIEHRGPVEHPGGDRSLYLRDPAGNLVEAWDFFKSGKGAQGGVEAL